MSRRATTAVTDACERAAAASRRLRCIVPYDQEKEKAVIYRRAGEADRLRRSAHSRPPTRATRVGNRAHPPSTADRSLHDCYDPTTEMVQSRTAGVVSVLRFTRQGRDQRRPDPGPRAQASMLRDRGDFDKDFRPEAAGPRRPATRPGGKTGIRGASGNTHARRADRQAQRQRAGGRPPAAHVVLHSAGSGPLFARHGVSAEPPDGRGGDSTRPRRRGTGTTILLPRLAA